MTTVDTTGMSASSLAAMNSTPSADGATSTAARKDTDDKDTFLKLLVAQMRYQDPSKPADSSQLMAQTATFSQVEKLSELATQNAALLAAQRTMTAGAMVGQTVTYTAADGTATTGKVTSVKIATTTKEAEAVINGVSVPLGRITTVSTADAAAVAKAAADATAAAAAAAATAAAKAAAEKQAADAASTADADTTPRTPTADVSPTE